MALLNELCSATAPIPVSRVPIDTRSLKKAILSKFLLFQPLMELSGIIDSSNRFCPLTAVAELSRGRAFPLKDYLICPGYLLAISLIGALKG